MKKETKCLKCGYTWATDNSNSNETCPFCKCEFEKKD